MIGTWMSKETSNVSKFYFLRLGKLNSSIVGYLNSMNTKFRVRDGMVHLNTADKSRFLTSIICPEPNMWRIILA